LPFFGPALILNIDVLDNNLTQDIPLVLTNVQRTDTYQGSMEEERMVIQDFIFEMKLNLFGPTDSNVSVIKTAIANINDTDGTVNRIYNVAVNPQEANEDDIFTLDENWTTP
jgi:hypothetical protein